MQNFFVAGFGYELPGLVFFLLYLVMSRPRAAGRYSRRTQVLVLPVLSLVSIIADARRQPPTRR